MPDVFNPYQNHPTLASNTRLRTVISDANQWLNAGEQIEHASYDNDGNRQADVTNVYLRTQDGRLSRNPETEPIYKCPTCNRGPLHAAVMRTCDDCGSLHCQSCMTTVTDEEGPISLCKQCYAHWKWSWLFSFTPSIRTSLRTCAK